MSNLGGNSYKFNFEELSGFCFQVSLMMHSGIFLRDGLEVMCSVRDQTSGGQKVLQGMVDELEQHTRLSDAMQKSKAFPSYMVGMVQLGENTGNLESVMSALSEHYKREERLRGIILGSVLYPAILLVMISAVIVVLLARVLPEFTRVLEDMGVESSTFNQTLISIGGSASQVVLAFIILLFAAVCALWIYSKISGKSLNVRDALLRIPFLRRVSDKIAAGQFASGMALAVTSGYEIDEAFALMSAIITNKRTLEKINRVSEKMADGSSLSQAIIISGVFDGMPERMVAVGEKAGKVGDVMREISDIYETETSISLSNIVSTIEPVMVAFLSVVTGVIMLAIMLPLLGIVSIMH